MKKAYILALHQLPEQANKLIKQIVSDGESDVYIHIDKKVTDNIKDKIIVNEHISFIDNPISINWGGVVY